DVVNAVDVGQLQSHVADLNTAAGIRVVPWHGRLARVRRVLTANRPQADESRRGQRTGILSCAARRYWACREDGGETRREGHRAVPLLLPRHSYSVFQLL